MPDAATDDREVASIYAAAELVKITVTGATESRSPETLASAFKTIHKAIVDARLSR